MKKLSFLFVAVVCACALYGKNPKYVFLFIGDGMATPQRMVADEFSRKMGRGQLAINTLPYHATTRTNCVNSLVTDSAAAATAIACGGGHWSSGGLRAQEGGGDAGGGGLC